MGADDSKLDTNRTVESKWLLPCLGFGSFLFIADDVNAPVLLPCDNDVSLASMCISFFLLALVIWWALKRNWDNRWNLPAIAVLTVLISFYYVIVLFVPAAMQHAGLAGVLDIAFMFGRAGLSFFWMVAILPLGSRRVCYVLTASMLLFAFYCLLIVLFKDGAARVLLVLLPLMSACCLHAFYRTRSYSFEISSPLKDDILVQSQEYLSLRSNHLVFATGIVVPLICGSTVLAFVNKTWPGVSMEFFQLFSAQMGLLIGSVVMALIQLILVRFFWTSTNFMFVSVLVPLALLVMLLIVISEPNWTIVYFALLLLVEKSLIAFGVYSSYMFRIGNNWMAPWCIAFLCIAFGGLLGEFLQFFPLGNPLFFLIALATIYVVSVCFASLHFGVKITQAYEGHLSGGFRGENSYSTAIRMLADSYDLTDRECDILKELGRGRNAAYIAERLSISPQTAKTHQKNVYAKMDLHSQQDLIMLVDRTIEDARLK